MKRAGRCNLSINRCKNLTEGIMCDQKFDFAYKCFTQYGNFYFQILYFGRKSSDKKTVFRQAKILKWQQLPPSFCLLPLHDLCVSDFIAVYVFLGDDHALIDLVRYMHARGFNNGDYVVIAVHDDPYDPHQQRYFNKCQSTALQFFPFVYSWYSLSYIRPK